MSRRATGGGSDAPGRWRTSVVAFAALAAGFALGLVAGGLRAPAAEPPLAPDPAHRPGASSAADGPEGRRERPRERRVVAESMVRAEVPEVAEPEAAARDDVESAGPLELRCLVPRTLLCPDAPAAAAGLSAYLDALGTETVVERAPGRARLRVEDGTWDVELLWKATAAGELVVRARQGDTDLGVRWVEARILEGIRGFLWARGVDVQRGPAADCEIEDRDALYAALTAFAEVMAERGYSTTQEDVLQAVVQFVARDASGRAVWLAEICPDTNGSYPVGVANLADPFDPQGEQALLREVLSRAHGRDVRLRD